MLINYLFNPPNFSYIPTDENGNPTAQQPGGPAGEPQDDEAPVEAGNFDEWSQP
jgi:hypothetical protein